MLEPALKKAAMSVYVTAGPVSQASYKRREINGILQDRTSEV